MVTGWLIDCEILQKHLVHCLLPSIEKKRKLYKMSKIPKLCTIGSSENRPRLLNGPPKSRTIANGLSDDDKNKLLINHTRPLRDGPTASNTAPAQRLKKASTAPSSTTLPGKVTKIDKKASAGASKISTYDYKARFNDLLIKHKAMKSEFNDLKEKHMDVSDEFEKMKVENEDLQRKTDQLQISYNDLIKTHVSLKEEIESLKVLTDNLKQVSSQFDKLLLEYKDANEMIIKYKSEKDAHLNMLTSMYKEQRMLRNTIQDLKGDIRVYCRVRPPLETESTKPLFNFNVLDACSIEVEKMDSDLSSVRKGKSQHSFTFDGIFTSHTSQEDVFAEVSPMVQSALDGYNVCIFAYGQTGSGKTYTMEGGCGTEQYGIIPRAFNMIFTSMEDLKTLGWELTIRASFLEIYNEVIYDLLNSSKDQQTHEIKMANPKGNEIYVSNLKEEEVKSSHDFSRLMINAQRNRQTAATLNNERSSRSHSVAQIKISAINKSRKEKFTSNLNLVDLAGSESGKTTQRMDETKHINRSLSELSNVIFSLRTNQSHIPYRNSKLTHLLMPSLGGNSKTLMLVNINQFDECFSETLNSLRFATKVNSCSKMKAKKNFTMVDTSHH